VYLSNEGILMILLVGLIAGWLAGKIVRGTGIGLIGDMAIGIVGAFIASWLLPRLGIGLGSGLIRAIIRGSIADNYPARSSITATSVAYHRRRPTSGLFYTGRRIIRGVTVIT
jgi:uncharacterized membrane protein YeaQ/YmgE (transglycosylase-associated protein family)